MLGDNILNITCNYAASFVNAAIFIAGSNRCDGKTINRNALTAKMIRLVRQYPRLSAEVQGFQVASRNAADAQSMIDAKVLRETHNVLQECLSLLFNRLTEH